MTNYNYNNLNAHEIANRIITREEEYLNTNYEELSFEEKCRYALEYTPIFHIGLAPNPAHRAALLNALRPELLRRSEQEDGFALYVLGSFNADCSALATDAEHRFLERSFKAGYLPAVPDLVTRFYRHCDEEARLQVSNEYLFPALIRLSSEKEWDLLLAHAIEELLALNEDIEEAQVAFYQRSLEDAEQAVSQGSYVGLAKLCTAKAKIGSQLAPARPEEAIAFWQTVDFLVHSYFYDHGARHLATTLGAKLINERGCERDVEKIKQIYTDLYLRFSYDRKTLLQIVGAPHGEDFEDLDDAERLCRLQIRHGNAEGHWRLILVALLRGDRQQLEAACREVCAAEDGKQVSCMLKAYNMLCKAKAV